MAVCRRKRAIGTGISQWFGVRWDCKEEKNRELATERNAWGKPFLVCHPEIHFNISHSGCLAACGFGDEPLGLDIQQCAAADYFRMADRFYTEADRELLRRTEETDRQKAFYQIWTKEESYAKWLGTALPKSIGKEKRKVSAAGLSLCRGIRSGVDRKTGRDRNSVGIIVLRSASEFCRNAGSGALFHVLTAVRYSSVLKMLIKTAACPYIEVRGEHIGT